MNFPFVFWASNVRLKIGFAQTNLVSFERDVIAYIKLNVEISPLVLVNPSLFEWAILCSNESKKFNFANLISSTYSCGIAMRKCHFHSKEPEVCSNELHPNYFNAGHFSPTHTHGANTWGSGFVRTNPKFIWTNLPNLNYFNKN